MAALGKYRLSQEADIDLEYIFDFTQAEFGFDQAVSYLRDLDEAFLLLSENPEIGRVRDEIKVGLRSLPKHSHVIFYRVLEDHIRIVRVLHGRRDLPEFFED